MKNTQMVAIYGIITGITVGQALVQYWGGADLKLVIDTVLAIPAYLFLVWVTTKVKW